MFSFEDFQMSRQKNNYNLVLFWWHSRGQYYKNQRHFKERTRSTNLENNAVPPGIKILRQNIIFQRDNKNTNLNSAKNIYHNSQPKQTNL